MVLYKTYHIKLDKAIQFLCQINFWPIPKASGLAEAIQAIQEEPTPESQTKPADSLPESLKNLGLEKGRLISGRIIRIDMDRLMYFMGLRHTLVIPQWSLQFWNRPKYLLER